MDQAATAVAAYAALIVSCLNLVWSIYDKRRDRARIRVQLGYHMIYSALGPSKGPFLGFTAANHGRRPITLAAFGFIVHRHLLLTGVPLSPDDLPWELGEGKSNSSFR